MEHTVQQEWSHELQRWVQKHWDAQHRRWYRTHYVDGQGWVFLDWLPVAAPEATHKRNDSAYREFASMGGHGGAAGPAGHRVRQGETVYGNYDFMNPKPDTHYETLDPSFCVRSKDFFTEGKVFSVLFTEPAGTTVTNYNDAFSVVKFNEYVHTQVRRFIVVRQKREFCFAIPIFTYGNQGTKKSGVVPSEHAIAYSYNYQPMLLPGESGITKEPICIIMNGEERPLSTSSRIYFGIHHPIQYNVKVKDLGYVHPDHVPNLKGYWSMENQGETNQAAEVTAAASAGYPTHGEEEESDEEGPPYST